MYIRFLRAEWTEEASGKVILFVEPVRIPPEPPRRSMPRAKREDIGDFYRPGGLLHYVNAQLTGRHIKSIQIRSPYKTLFQLKLQWDKPPLHQISISNMTIHRAEAILRIIRTAQSHLGTPLIWGHNRGRGDQGFDPFTFVFFVYKKALGLPVSDVLQLQQIGQPIDWRLRPMSPGDLLIFAEGRHLGIFTGAGRYLCAGGGSGKVGYQDLHQGRYRLSNLTMVRRLV